MAFRGILPEVPSFGTQLARGIGAGLGAGVSQTANLLSESVKERMKAQAKSQSLLSTLSQLGGEKGDFDLSNLTPEQQGMLATQHPEFVTAYQAAQKAQRPQKEKEKGAENVLNISKTIRGLLKYTGSRWAPGAGFDPTEFLNREAIQKREEFDSLGASYASYFRDLDTKNQLPLGLYQKVIEPRIPNSELSERVNLGRIEALEELAREYGGLNAKKTSKKNGSSAEPMVKMQAKDGTEAFVPKGNVSAAMKKGAKVIR